MTNCPPIPQHKDPSFLMDRDDRSEDFNLCLIGAGPNALYCLERLLTRLHSKSWGIDPCRLVVTICDKLGDFGAGVHSRHQSPTNHLNRTAEQVSFCADSSHAALGIEVHEREIRTLYQWAAQKYKRTNDDRYYISPQHWVDRALVGEALSEIFQEYVNELQRLKVSVKLVAAEVVDLMCIPGGRFEIICENNSFDGNLLADFVVLCTGHTTSRPEDGSLGHILQQQYNQSSISLKYCNSAYPIERIDNSLVPPNSSVACFGMGLTAIDCINWLTVGRGGYFVSEPGTRKLRYVSSGFEPRKIYPMSDSGLFVRARAYNEKENVEGRRHMGIVFTNSTFDLLRETRSIRGSDYNSIKSEVVPLLALEMMMLYYRTLLSGEAMGATEERIRQAINKHIGACQSPKSVPDFWAIYRAGSEWYRQHLQHLEETLTRKRVKPFRLEPIHRSALIRFAKVRVGEEHASKLKELYASEFISEAVRLSEMESPWGHSASILEHAFDFEAVVDPLARVQLQGSDLHSIATAFLERDILNASQGNLTNPLKAAVDGSIRDLRSCFRAQVEWGAGGPEGTRELFSKWYRITNRLAVGTSLDLMRKLLALIEGGFVDLSFCRRPDKELCANGLLLKLDTHFAIVDVAVNAVVHRFNLKMSESKLYQNLSARGLIREWAVLGETDRYSPGAVDIERSSRLVVARNGKTIQNVAALGGMVDGPLYYRLALSRPYVADTILFDADQVVASIVKCWEIVRK